MSKSRIAGLLPVVLGLIALSWLARASGPVQAFNPQPEPPGYGAIGLWESTSLSVHLVNVKSADVPGALTPCVADVEFFDEIGESLGVRSRLVVRPGAIVSADLVLPAGIGGRMTVRPVIRFMREVHACDAVLSSAEVVGADGATHVFVNPLTLRGFNPQPEPPGR